MRLNKGDIVVYFTEDDEKWIIIFQSWCHPAGYAGYMHYYALYTGKDLYIRDTCRLYDEITDDDLKPANEEERKIILDELEKKGYYFNDNNKSLTEL